MGFKRRLQPESFSTGDSLTRDLIGIGFVLSGKANRQANIENTLFAAAQEGMAGDYRTLGLLVQWIELHLRYVNADRLIRLVSESDQPRVRAFWVAMAQWQVKDRRFVRLLKLKPKARVDLLVTGTEFQIRRRGEDLRFRGTCLRVPADLLRHREGDILSAHELARRNIFHRYRVMMGPSYRADMWALLESHPKLNASELARLGHGSFATAWNVIQDRLVAAP